ncbi:MAG: hypothetical protein KAT46_04630 [Deltaproteobacteria bacterium]|nr:hypothetical protein [Deltaproteobacteria bacterium]
MKKTLLVLVFVFSFLTGAALANAGFDLNLSLSSGKLTDFQLSISNHYRVSEAEIGIIAGRGISGDDTAVVLFLAGAGGVANSAIMELRLGGASWMDIALKFGVGADKFYVPFDSNPGPPYGKAYGYYKNKPKKEWKNIKLSDSDIVGLVNIKFLSEHHGISAGEVVRMKEKGSGFPALDARIKKGKEKSHGSDTHSPYNEEKNKSKGGRGNGGRGQGRGR